MRKNIVNNNMDKFLNYCRSNQVITEYLTLVECGNTV